MTIAPDATDPRAATCNCYVNTRTERLSLVLVIATGGHEWSLSFYPNRLDHLARYFQQLDDDPGCPITRSVLMTLFVRVSDRLRSLNYRLPRRPAHG